MITLSALYAKTVVVGGSGKNSAKINKNQQRQYSCLFFFSLLFFWLFWFSTLFSSSSWKYFLITGVGKLVSGDQIFARACWDDHLTTSSVLAALSSSAELRTPVQSSLEWTSQQQCFLNSGVWRKLSINVMRTQTINLTNGDCGLWTRWICDLIHLMTHLQSN